MSSIIIHFNLLSSTIPNLINLSRTLLNSLQTFTLTIEASDQGHPSLTSSVNVSIIFVSDANIPAPRRPTKPTLELRPRDHLPSSDLSSEFNPSDLTDLDQHFHDSTKHQNRHHLSGHQHGEKRVKLKAIVIVVTSCASGVVLVLLLIIIICGFKHKKSAKKRNQRPHAVPNNEVAFKKFSELECLSGKEEPYFQENAPGLRAETSSLDILSSVKSKTLPKCNGGSDEFRISTCCQSYLPLQVCSTLQSRSVLNISSQYDFQSLDPNFYSFYNDCQHQQQQQQQQLHQQQQQLQQQQQATKTREPGNPVSMTTGCKVHRVGGVSICR